VVAASTWRWARARRRRSIVAACAAICAGIGAGTKGIDGNRTGSTTRTHVTRPPRGGTSRATKATARRECGDPSTPTTMRR
jgi:hypothetical protein